MITVVTATTFKIEQHAEAIRRTMAALPVPSEGLLLSSYVKGLTLPLGIAWMPLSSNWCPGGQWTRADYSRFMLQGLVDYIDTEFCITVQWDGFGVNRDKWSDDFLRYDYCGAPWPDTMNRARVGNGGCSIRSHRWLKATSRLPDPKGANEDDWTCRIMRPDLLKAGLKIAPLDVAARFSIEHPIPEWPARTVSETWGFHGNFTEGTKGMPLQ